MAYWENKVMHAVNPDAFTEAANKLGSESWELVHVEYVHGFITSFFKRPVIEVAAPVKKKS